MRSASLPLQSLTKAATSPSRRARASASRLSGAGDCEQPVKIRNPKVMNPDDLRFMYISFPPEVTVFSVPASGIIHVVTPDEARETVFTDADGSGHDLDRIAPMSAP